MMGPFPNELWISILSDVLGTYIHSLILLPTDYDCWHAHFILRSVSKKFKTLVDSIWASAVGPDDDSSRTFRKLHDSLCTGDPVAFTGISPSPLIIAYVAYIAALREEVHPGERFLETANQIKFNFGPGEISDRLFTAVSQVALKIRPPEAGYMRGCAASTALIFSVDERQTTLEQGAVSVVSSIKHLPEGLGIAFFTFNRTLPLLASWDRKTAIEYKYVMEMEAIIRSLPAPTELPEDLDAMLRYSALSLTELSTSITSFADSWFEEYEEKQIRKRALHRTASYGVRGWLRLTKRQIRRRREVTLNLGSGSLRVFDSILVLRCTQ